MHGSIEDNSHTFRNSLSKKNSMLPLTTSTTQQYNTYYDVLVSINTVYLIKVFRDIPRTIWI